MKQLCKKCGRELRDGDPIQAVVLSVFREISSHVSYAIEKPYECVSIEHVNCENPQEEPAP